MALQILPDTLLVDHGLSLRRPRRTDGPALIAAVQDPEIPRWTTVPSPYGQTEFDAWMDRAELWSANGDLRKNYLIVDADDQLVGMIGAVRIDEEDEVVELGYWLAPPARGKGIIARALMTLMKATLHAGYQRLTAEVLVGNSASQHVLERAGFTHEGILRSIGSHGCGDGAHRIDIHMYSVILSDQVAVRLLSEP
jgi:RimJ/RimL family protein N-acetyltransferase